MSDRLEEIKKRYIRETMDYDTAWLITEVDRLENELAGLLHYEEHLQSLEKQIESLQSQLAEAEEFIESQSKDICGYLNKIATVEKERNETKATFENSDKLIMSQAGTIKKLEAENAKLKERVEELRIATLKHCNCPYPNLVNTGGTMKQCSHCGGWKE